MNPEYWHRQSSDVPLFPDLLWSRPENRQQAGKLCILGGNAFGFAAAAAAYAQAISAGIGAARVVLPDSLRKTVGRVFEAGEYVPSTPSGSFSRQALSEVMAATDWADATLLAGDLGRNSETAILLEKLFSTYVGQLTITKDAVDYFSTVAPVHISRPDTTLVLSFAQLQKLAMKLNYPQAFTFDMDFLRLIDRLHAITQTYGIQLITKHLDTIFVAVKGQVSSTKCAPEREVWRVDAAAWAAVMWLQNPAKPFESLTTSLLRPTGIA